MEIFKPANIDGSALGNCTLKNVANVLSPIDRARSSFSRSIEASPIAVLITTGRKGDEERYLRPWEEVETKPDEKQGRDRDLGTACEETKTG